MNEAAATVGSARSPFVGGSPPARDARRVLQLALATVWLIDGLLQFQPFMFSRAFGTQMPAGTAHGNPSAIAHSISWAGLAIGHHSVPANSAFALIQVLIGLGIAWRRSVKPALAVSIAWSFVVWWFGEGLGGLLSGTANPLNGAPGAVLLYAFLAVVLWPVDRSGAPSRFVAARAVGEPITRGLWVVLWGSLGFVAVGVWLPANVSRVSTAVALVVSAVIWVVGENFGGIFSGSGTDPNSGPLLMLVAVAYWPNRTSVAFAPAEDLEPVMA